MPNRDERIATLARGLTDERALELLQSGSGLELAAAHAAVESRPHLAARAAQVRASIRTDDRAAMAARVARAARLAAQLADAHFALLAAGFSLEYASDLSCHYARGPRARIRVSDHRVPTTAEREHNATHGGFSWTRQGVEIILPAADLEREIREAIECYEEEN